VVHKVTVVFNGSNRTQISSKTERRDLDIVHLDISLSNCDTLHVIRKRSSVCRSLKYSRKIWLNWLVDIHATFFLKL